MTSKTSYQENVSPSDTRQPRSLNQSNKANESTPRSFHSPHPHGNLYSNNLNVDLDKYKISSPDVSLKPFIPFDHQSLQTSPAYYTQTGNMHGFKTPQSQFISQKRDFQSNQSKHRAYNSYVGTTGLLQSPMNYLSSSKYSKPADLLSPKSDFRGLISEGTETRELHEDRVTGEEVKITHMRKETDTLISGLLQKYGGENLNKENRTSNIQYHPDFKPRALEININDLLKNLPSDSKISVLRERSYERRDRLGASPYYASPTSLRNQSLNIYSGPKVVITQENDVNIYNENVQDKNEAGVESSKYYLSPRYTVSKPQEKSQQPFITEEKQEIYPEARRSEIGERTTTTRPTLPEIDFSSLQQDRTSYEYTKASEKSSSSNLGEKSISKSDTKNEIENIEMVDQQIEDQMPEVSDTESISHKSNAGSEIPDLGSITSPGLAIKEKIGQDKENSKPSDQEITQEEKWTENVLGEKRAFGRAVKFGNLSNIQQDGSVSFKQHIEREIIPDKEIFSRFWNFQDKENMQKSDSAFRSGTKNQEIPFRQAEPLQVLRTFTNYAPTQANQYPTANEFKFTQKENMQEDVLFRNKWSDLTRPLLAPQEVDTSNQAKQFYCSLQTITPKLSEPKEFEQETIEDTEESQAPYCLEEDKEVENIENGELERLNEEEKLKIEERTKEIRERESHRQSENKEEERRSFSSSSENEHIRPKSEHSLNHGYQFVELYRSTPEINYEFEKKEELNKPEPLAEERIKRAADEKRLSSEESSGEDAKEKVETESQSSQQVSEVKPRKRDNLRTYGVILGLLITIFLWHFVLMWADNMPEDTQDFEIQDIDL